MRSSTSQAQLHGHVQEGDGRDMWLFSEGIERVTVRYEGVDYTLVEDGE